MSIDGQFGGRITFEFDGQRIAPTEGAIKIDPGLVETSAKANQDGSAAYEMKPSLVAAEFSLRHQDGVDWNAMLFKKGNLTIVEENNNRTHLFTGTRLVGKPKVDLSTGSVDGLQAQGGSYQRIDS